MFDDFIMVKCRNIQKTFVNNANNYPVGNLNVALWLIVARPPCSTRS